MKLLRQRLWLGILSLVAVAAVVGVVGVVCLPRWLETRGGQSSARTRAVVASTDTARVPSLSSAVPVALPERAIDLDEVRRRFGSWAEAPVRDPFQAYGLVRDSKASQLAAAPATPLVLNGIWRQSGSSLAVINHHVYGPGDEVEGYKVERIEADRVLLRGAERQEVLRFGPRESPVSHLNGGTGEKRVAQVAATRRAGPKP
jgi:type II secretory pathway component PulC